MSLAEKWYQHVWRRVGYEPSTEQLSAHNWPARLKLVAGGERGGKSYSAAMELLRACALVRHGLYWIVGPTYDLARPEFQYVANALLSQRATDPRSISWPRQGPCSLTTAWGVEIATRSADDPVKLAGVAPDGVLMCEAAQQNYETFLRLRGRIAEKRGWLWLSGTFEGSTGYFSDLYSAWQADNEDGGRSFSLPTWSNRVVYPGGRDDEEIKRLEAIYPADRFQERFGAVPCPPANLVFREFSYATHVRTCEYEPRLPVEVWVDPGWATAYAVLAVQFQGDDVYVIGEVYEQNMSHEEVIGELRRRPYGPNVQKGVIDFAGRQHQADRSAVDVWRAAGITLRSQPVSIEAGIDRVKTFLREPRTHRPRIAIDPSCKNFCREFGLYRYRVNAEMKPVSDTPLDIDNHALKACAYGLIDRFGFVDRAPRRQQEPQLTFKVRA
jgi:hypothetical protein